MHYFKKYSPFINLLVLFIVVNVILRIVLIFHPITQSGFGLMEIVKIFGFGMLSDVFVFMVASAFLWLYLLFLSNSKYEKPYGYVIFGGLLLLLGYVSFFNTILNEYGGSLPEIGISFIALKTILFGLLLFLPRYRNQIRFVLYWIAIFIFVLIIVQNSISEFFFWNEFGVRYNFIAVDYLVYTNTVIGNIMESYPVVPLFLGVGLITALLTYFIVKRTKPFLNDLPSFAEKIKGLGAYVILFIVSLFAIPFLANQEKSSNVFTNELQADGMYKFYVAFMNNELEFHKFYKTIPDAEAFVLLQKQLPDIKNESTLRTIKSDSAEIHKNVVLITIESYSAEFMKAYGNEKNITPFLDSLAQQSLQFTNLYAVGNRTVRGLEAVTLCLPPSAAESVVKRKDNKNKFSTGNIFKQKGYNVKYMYGGDAFFDNMGDFFGGNGYDIVDKKTFTPEEITFSNIWGVCDEDMYNKAIKVMNAEAKENKPFFNHIMTVSNHRPFTYPEGKIDISGKAKSRDGGVKYTDYALKQFFAMASKQPWFKNTVFVILADHCASSSGKTELPMDKYHIPAFIYSPGFVPAKEETILMSQIDIMPTLFGLLHFSYESKFYGQNVFSADYKPRAFVATYQDLGLIKDNVLTIISPVKKVKQFGLTPQPNSNLKPGFQLFYDEKPMTTLRDDLVNETISFYQTSAYLLKNKKYQK
ncbi:MAG TPA: sulfatase-like hydrolase/transferase [Flavobacterium sp.]|uniref:LTA synthase family protein n=1 Tax=Flavobacterium sp. TaxID=239 RepID=UPI002B5CAC0E|nr:sulfatase-like hydrolase/transferase [Flavobacterium sp.]HNP32817.1 sulfatase-like hydrolase/transferase [Flavobacterium sp.]